MRPSCRKYKVRYRCYRGAIAFRRQRGNQHIYAVSIADIINNNLSIRIKKNK